MRRLRILTFLVLVFGSPALDARAADDPFTVTGIQVDASATSATEAQTIAINSGRARAWAALFHRLTKQQDWSRQPALDDVTIQRLIRSYLPVNERRSTTRYVANMTYIFNPDAVRRVFRQYNIAYADMQARPILVVPMAPGYQPRGAWTLAWANPRYSGAAVPLVLPLGDTVDVSALGVLKFPTSTWQDVEAVASRVHADEAWLVLLQPANGQLSIKLKRLAAGNSPPIPDILVPVPPKTPVAKAYASAADVADNAIVDAWKARSAIDFGKRSKLIAEFRIESLASWSAMLQKLATVSTIADVGVVGMNTGEARIAISYVGSSDQLSELVRQAGYDLSNTNGTWWLSPQPANSDAAGQ
jgi:hypothetical protein